MPVLLLLMVTSLCAQVSQSQQPSVDWVKDPGFASLQPPLAEPELRMEPSDLLDCAALCSTKTWCSSFMYISEQAQCLLFKIVYLEIKDLLEIPGAEYYRVASDSCPVQECFAMSRPDNLCFLYLNESRNYEESRDLCKTRNGRLAILDTLSKNEWIVSLLKMNGANNDATLYLGAEINGTVFTWFNGNQVAVRESNHSFWADDPRLPNENCLILQSVDLVIRWLDVGCGRRSSGVLCEYQPANN